MNKPSVLIAEDNEDMRIFLKWMLESEGFTVNTAEDGAIALDSLSASRPDVILTDLMMPQMDGLELIRLLRNQPVYHDIPIVAMTAYGDKYMAQAKGIGATASIRKPEDLERLVETINDVLPPLNRNPPTI